MMAVRSDVIRDEDLVPSSAAGYAAPCETGSNQPVCPVIVSANTYEHAHVRNSGEVAFGVLRGGSHEELPGSADMQSRCRPVQYRDLY